jgi:hypothetical protein
MFRVCRPTGRLFYWVLAVVVVTASSTLVSAREGASAGKPTPQGGPALTSVIDTVYMANGSPAQGVLVITWPAFVAANGTAVVPGSLNVTLGTNGALNVALTPNAGATPANTYYTVVYQLQPSEVRTEYWVVPTSSPATLAEVRTTPGTGTAAQPVSIQYVNTALAAKANDNTVVHLSGTETVTGAKSFAVPPNVPAPVGTGDVANKSYVDNAIANVGAGNYLPTAGGTMTGALTLSGPASYVTQLVGALSDGAECEITSSPSLDFYPAYVPALNELIVASYRGRGRAVAQVENAASVASLQNGADDGTRGAVRVAKNPHARTDVDCENAALAILDDATGRAWSGNYETWSDFLPGGAEDIFPGDALTVNVPSREASFTAIVREVEIQIADPADDRGFYTIEFANDLAAPLGIEYGASATTIALQDTPPLLETTQVGTYYQVDLTDAQITAVSSTTVSVDVGMPPPSGGGVEVRAHDFGWGQANNRNLLGRFNTQAFTLARLAKTQNYFLRLYDGSSPPKYSRYSAALHVDYPL